MSALTVTDTLSVDAALAVVRDILAQTDGDAVLLALRRVGPLCLRDRHSLSGPVGGVRYAIGAPAGGLHEWSLYTLAWHHLGEAPAVTRGHARTVDEADGALVMALEALGWTCAGGTRS